MTSYYNLKPTVDRKKLNNSIVQKFLSLAIEDSKVGLDIDAEEALSQIVSNNSESLDTSLIENPYFKVARRILDCSSYTAFAECNSCSSWHYVGSQLCKNRFCFICARKRGLSYLRRYGELLNSYEEQGYKLYFMTITLKNMWDLKEMLDRFNKTFKRFREKYSIFYNFWEGGIISREITYNNATGWHVHIHAVVLTKETIPDLSMYNQEFSSKWLQKTEDSFITNIKPCKSKIKNGKKYKSYLLELFKYITDLKSVKDMTDEEFKIIYDTLHRRRMISTFGSLYNQLSSIEKQVDEDASSYNYGSLVDAVCAVCGCDEFTLNQYYTLGVSRDRSIYRFEK